MNLRSLRSICSQWRHHVVRSWFMTFGLKRVDNVRWLQFISQKLKHLHSLENLWKAKKFNMFYVFISAKFDDFIFYQYKTISVLLSFTVVYWLALLWGFTDFRDMTILQEITSPSEKYQCKQVWKYFTIRKQETWGWIFWRQSLRCSCGSDPNSHTWMEIWRKWKYSWSQDHRIPYHRVVGHTAKSEFEQVFFFRALMFAGALHWWTEKNTVQMISFFNF